MSASDPHLVAGADVGGTFTDLVILDPLSGQVRLAKVPTTLDPASGGQAGGVLAAFDQAGVALSDIRLIVHGTTTTTNAVLERKLARTGLITTEGFRDVLELGRRTRPNAYGMTGQFIPVISRDLRLEIPERMDARGQVITPLDEDALRAAVADLLGKGCESLVIHFLHSYANPDHERRAAAIARALWPNPYVTAGHELLSESREFERGVTAAVNAAVQPLLERYVTRLADALAARGYARDLVVMNGNGGMVPARAVGAQAVKTVMSGPASGVMAAIATGRRAGMGNLITYDMGGTSTDVALIRDLRAPVSNEIEVEYAMPIHVPMVDVRTVGAGGGSIARVDGGGMLRVGPDSAGSDPGPVCYGRGGTQLTISDANLLLGRLPRSRFGAGAVGLEDMFARLGAPIGLSGETTAGAVVRLANTHMAGAIRMVSVSLGADPRDFALFAFGGAGPLHASALARELSIPKVLVPARPGLTNALGCITADLRQDFLRTLNRPLPDCDLAEVAAVLAGQAAEGRARVDAAGIALTGVTVEHFAEMQFLGQTHLLRVPVPAAPTRADLQARFEAAYHARFRVHLPEIRAVLVNLGTAVIGTRPEADLSRLIDPDWRRSRLEDAQTGNRPVWFDRWHFVPVYWRDHLPATSEIAGPAVIEQMDTTILLHPGDRAGQDSDGNLIVEVGG